MRKDWGCGSRFESQYLKAKADLKANILKANADLKAKMLEQQRSKQPDAW